MFGFIVTIPSTILEILLVESVNSTSYKYLPDAMLAVVFADRAKVKTPVVPPVVTTKLTAFDEV